MRRSYSTNTFLPTGTFQPSQTVMLPAQKDGRCDGEHRSSLSQDDACRIDEQSEPKRTVVQYVGLQSFRTNKMSCHCLLFCKLNLTHTQLNGTRTQRTGTRSRRTVWIFEYEYWHTPEYEYEKLISLTPCCSLIYQLGKHIHACTNCWVTKPHD